MDALFRRGQPVRRPADASTFFPPVEISSGSIRVPCQLKLHGIAERLWPIGYWNDIGRSMVSILAKLLLLSGGHLTCAPAATISRRPSGCGVANRSGKSHPGESSISGSYRSVCLGGPGSICFCEYPDCFVTHLETPCNCLRPCLNALRNGMNRRK